MITKVPDVSFYYFDAINELTPGIKYNARVDEEGVLLYDDINVDEGTGELASLEDIIIKAEEIRNRTIQNSYIGKRRNEYPSVSNFLDAWVKNDEDALEEYRQQCLAVKEKYPKP